MFPIFPSKYIGIKMKFKRALKIILVSIGILILLILMSVYCFINGVPFIEGSKDIIKGEGYGFRIGMIKEECFEIVKKGYNQDDNLLYAYWDDDEEGAKEISKFQDTLQAVDPNRSRGLFKKKISKLEKILIPYSFSENWIIEIPSTLKVRIRLSFIKNELKKIVVSKSLFDRK